MVRSPMTCMTRRPVAQRAELVEGGERRPGVGGLVAQGAVELGGVAHRLVDGEPQVGGVDDEVIGAGLDRRGRHLLGQEPGDRARARRPSPSRCRRCTPSPGRPGGARVRIDSKRPGRRRPRPRPRPRMHAHPALGGRPSRQVGEVLVLDDGQHTGRRRGRPAPSRAGAALQSSSSATLSARGTVGGVELVGRGPRDLAVAGLVGQHHGRAQRRRPCRGPAPRPRRPARRRRRVELHRGGEADGAVVHHAQAHADLGVVDGRLDDAVAQRDVLRADALDADLGVAAPQRRGPLQGRAPARLVQRQPRQARRSCAVRSLCVWSRCRSGSPGAHAGDLSRPRRPGRADVPALMNGIMARSSAPTFSMGCAAPAARSCLEALDGPARFSAIHSSAKAPDWMSSRIWLHRLRARGRR